MEKIMEMKKDGKDTVLIVLKSQLLADDNENFKEAFDKVFDQLGQETVMDLSKVEYISSLILASMMYILKRITEAKKTLVLKGIRPKVQEMLRVTNLDKIFSIQ